MTLKPKDEGDEDAVAKKKTMIIRGVVIVVIAWIFRPSKPNVIKSSTYECGVETIGDTWVQFRVQYYIYGLIFLVFDVEMVFLFPWAVAYNEMSLFGFVAGFLFIFLLTDALFYAWSKNALEWK